MDLFASLFDLLPELLKGAWVTVEITLFSAFLAFCLSFLIAFMRLSKRVVLAAGALLYVEFFRGTSALVQLFYLFYILPLFGITMPALLTGIIGLGLNMAAYGSEVVRGSLLSVHLNQHEAASALGLSRWQSLRLVIIPQAMALIWPAFGNLLVELVKASSLVSLITLTDLTFSGIQMVLSTGRIVEVWGVVMVLYFCMAYPLSKLAAKLEKRATLYRLSPR